MKASVSAYTPLLGGLAMWAFLLVGAGFLIRNYPESPWNLAIAFIPVVPVVVALQTEIRYVDRLKRDLKQPRLGPGSFAFACTLCLVATFGLLELGVGLRRLPTVVLPVFMLAFWSLGKFLTLSRAAA